MKRFVLDNFTQIEQSQFGTQWLHFSDKVMGGKSEISAKIQSSTSGSELKLSGRVMDSGFIQSALPLVQSRYLFDAEAYEGVYVQCRSLHNREYAIHLRSRELSMPWQHFCHAFQSTESWAELLFPFSHFKAQATQHELDRRHLTRIGIVAESIAGEADLRIREIGFYTLD